MSDKMVFMVIGALFAIVGIVFLIYTIKLKMSVGLRYIKLIGTISDIERIGDNHKVVVGYEYKGNAYTSRLHYWHSGMRVGNQIKILIDSVNPEKVMGSIKMYMIFGICFTLFGLLFIYFAVTPYVIL